MTTNGHEWTRMDTNGEWTRIFTNGGWQGRWRWGAGDVAEVSDAGCNGGTDLGQ